MTKILALMSLSLFTTAAFATGEYTQVKCTSATNSGKIVTVEACVSGEGDMLVACAGEEVEYVTITRATPIPKAPEFVEIVKVPALLVDFVWEEELFSLELDYAPVGKFDLEFVGGEVSGEMDQKLVLDMPNMKHSFKAVGCEFTSNEM